MLTQNVLNEFKDKKKIVPFIILNFIINPFLFQRSCEQDHTTALPPKCLQHSSAARLSERPYYPRQYQPQHDSIQRSSTTQLNIL